MNQNNAFNPDDVASWINESQGNQSAAQPQQSGQPSSASNSFDQQSLSNLTEMMSGNIIPRTNPFVQGVGGAIQNTIAGAANLIPGLNLPYAQKQSNPLYGAGNIAGNIGMFMGGGEGIDAIRAMGAAKTSIPAIKTALDYLGQSSAIPSMIRQGLGTGAYGELTNPQDRARGATEGTIAGVATAALPPAIRGASPYLGDFLNKISPSSMVDKIGSLVGQGKSLEDNGKSLAQNIQEGYEKNKAEGDKLYQPVFDAAGNDEIYPTNSSWKKYTKGYSRIDSSNSEYLNLPSKYTDNYDFDLQDMHNNLLKNPTFQNAHDLQSQLGFETRSLEKQNLAGNLNLAGKNRLISLGRSQDALQNDMSSYLKSKPGNLDQQYQDASANWLKNVVPYTDTPQLSEIAKGETTNPRNIVNIFKNPESDVQKVVGDMPKDFGDRLVYQNLGKVAASKSGEALQNAFSKLGEQGLGSYPSENLQSQMGALASSIKNKDALSHLTGVLTGGVLGAHLGLGPELGGAMGMLASPLAMSAAKKVIPGVEQNIPGSLYPYLKNALLANAIPGAQ